MDNNPFRNHQSTGNAYSSPLGGQQQQQFQYQQQQPQQQYPYQQPQQQQALGGYQQSYNIGGNNGYSSSGAQYQQPMSTAMGGALSPTQQQAQWQQQSAYQFTPSTQSSNTDLFSNTQYNTSSNLMSPTSNGYTQQQSFNSMPQPYGGQQQVYNQYMQQGQDNSNFYIPPNFGMNTTNNTFQQQTPKHPPVDASSLLKGTQVRKITCPICNKTIEGDDMALNHHVNQHL